MRPPVVHYLRPNEGARTPAAVAYLDIGCESRPDGDDLVVSPRAWAGRLVVRRPGDHNPAVAFADTGSDCAGLVEWIGKAAHGRHSLWCYMHDLGRDMLTGDLPRRLIDAGWRLGDWAMSVQAPWLRAKRGGCALALLDSWSILPAPVDRLAQLVGVISPPPPPAGAEQEAWEAWTACQADTLAAAMEELLAWWDRDQLGRWSITGPTTGWAAMRHKLPRDPGFTKASGKRKGIGTRGGSTSKAVLIDPDPVMQARDRAAIYTGRRHVTAVGEFRGGPFLEVDFRDAHATVAAFLPLPCRRAFEVDYREPGRWHEMPGRWEPLAECVVSVEAPRYPLRTGAHVLYPVGEFSTTLAGPEIREARERGELVSVGAGMMHRLDTHLSEWGKWILTVTRGEAPDTPEVASVAAKAWGRSVIGKWATRAWDRVELGAWDPAAWHYSAGGDAQTGGEGALVFLAGKAWWTFQLDYGPEAYPAVWSWVESYVRVALGRLLEAAGPDAIMVANTDGAILDASKLGTDAANGSVTLPGARTQKARVDGWLAAAAELTWPLEPRIKARFNSVSVYGPQSYQPGTDRRLSGVPKTAKADDTGRLHYHTWPGLAEGLIQGAQGEIRRRHVVAAGMKPHPTGWLTTTGCVLPPIARVTDAGVTELVPWAETLFAAAGHRLAPEQHPALSRLG
jgi:hypothetical protein